MSDTTDSPADALLRRHLPTGVALARLRHTPLRDLVRGRVTGRLDWRGVIASSALPASIRNLTDRVVRRTRLWRIERAEVAQELIAHFTDGLAAGTPLAALVRDFGDERQAAKLIRRAKRRNRPITWQARKWLLRGVLALVALYAVNLVRFFLGHAQVKVDYIAQLNAATDASVPPDQAAWPLYRQAILALRIEGQKHGGRPAYPSELEKVEAVESPQSSDWPLAVRWLDANQSGLDLVRQAAARPKMGFVYGPGGSAQDPQLGWKLSQVDAANPLSGAFMSVLLPQLSAGREMAKLLRDDFYLALDRGEAARAARDYETMLAVARHLDAPLVINGLVKIAIDDLALDALGRALVEHPERFDDTTLVALAHTTARIGDGGDTTSCLIDLSGERMSFHDLMQRIYTDDGNGDGRLTPAAVRALGAIFPGRSLNASESTAESAAAMLLAAGLAITDSRRDNEREYDRLMDITDRAFARPYREGGEAGSREVERTMAWVRATPVRTAHYMPVALLTPSLSRAGVTAERLLAKRDALTAGLALELYRRHHGGYPASLDELVPVMLPHVPVDRVTGDAIHYRLINGNPVIYSVGVDLDDDGGRPPINRNEGIAMLDHAAIGNPPPPAVPPSYSWHNTEGDWLLYGRPLIDAEDEVERHSREADAAPTATMNDTAAGDGTTTQPTTRPATR